MPYTIDVDDVAFFPIRELRAAGETLQSEISEASAAFDTLVIERNLTQSQLPISQDDYDDCVRAYVHMFFAMCVYRNRVGIIRNDVALESDKYLALYEWTSGQLPALKASVTKAVLLDVADTQEEIMPESGTISLWRA